jgi:gluconolactonase
MRPPGAFAAQPEFAELIDPQAALEKVATGFGTTAGLVFSRIGFLLFSDVQQEKIYRWNKPATKSDPENSTYSVFRTPSGRANGLTFDHQGRLLTCESGAGRVTRTEKDGSITILAERFEGKEFLAPSDLVYNIDGSICFCDASAGQMPANGSRIEGPAVYRIARSQIPGASRLERISRECDRPVGVALSPRQDLLYVSDAAQRNIRVHSINDNGSLAQGRVFAELHSDEAGEQAGLKTDERGNVYAVGPAGLWIFSPSGKHLGLIVVPERPSNCCWGGGFSGLYITAGTSLYYIATKIPGTKTF